jgi:hypothetical protein
MPNHIPSVTSRPTASTSGQIYSPIVDADG